MHELINSLYSYLNYVQRHYNGDQMFSGIDYKKTIFAKTILDINPILNLRPLEQNEIFAVYMFMIS